MISPLPSHRPRITLAALKGGAGKTILSLGLAASWLRRGHKVAPFKKGPDFIDSGWLSFASQRPCYNLDPFLMSREQILDSYLCHSMGADISLIEGNRGLYDGVDAEGSCSTAELARMLCSPVILIVDVTKVSRTAAALILGCRQFDPELQIAGIILNKVGGTRHESVLRNSIERYCGLPILGAVPKLGGNFFPERHMGLIPHQERRLAQKAVEWAVTVAETHLDLDALWRLAQGAGPLQYPHVEREAPALLLQPPLRVGVIRDRAFWFYYPDNLNQIEHLGASLLEIDAANHQELPDLDALYIGGGFPETQARALADNEPFRAALRRRIEDGLPVYAECGGLMYLGEELVVEGKSYPMVGALPLKLIVEKKPQGHGYTVLETVRENPYYRVGEVIKGHEFHYSRAVPRDPEAMKPVFKVLRGWGLDGETDGLCRRNLLALYTHVHGGGNPLWARALLRKADWFRRQKPSGEGKETRVDSTGDLR